MTGLYVYGITAGPTGVRARGAMGRPLRTIRIGRLHAVVESAHRAPHPTLSRIKAQNRVVATFVARGVDMLPARFGSFVAGRDELERAMLERDAELRRALARVKGCVQMTLRLRAEPPPRDSPVPVVRTGAEYLRERAARERSRRVHPLVRAIQRAGRPYARATRVDWQRAPASLACVHHLVPRGRVGAYREAVTRAVQRQGGEAVMSGPWAPFAFVEVA